ncbi:MAG: non-homologous end-joining DNA ligase [Actinomycetota bacterium]|nr:non-homologous end-joining DNA ligase [Actinomycetota bacterium]
MTPPATSPQSELEVEGRVVTITNPDKVFFSARGETKLDLALYYVAVGQGALRGVYERPTVLKRFPNGAEGDFFYQKRAPVKGRPSWLETVTVAFPSGRSAEELCPTDVAHVVWAANLGCIDLNPWPVRRNDVDHPDELRVDLDPQPGVSFATVREVALEAKAVLDEHGLASFPKTSGSRGMHLNVRIQTRWGFTEVRRAALALARELERRRPHQATSAWWKEERGERVFVDYNQNARDRTVASAYSVRANPEGRVSCPLDWEEVADVEPADLTIATVPARYAQKGDPGASIDDNACSLDALLELAARDEEEGLGDAPWPPHFAKQRGEPRRVQPSKARAEPEPPAS